MNERIKEEVQMNEKDLAREVKWLRADVMAIMSFLESQALADTNKLGAGRIVMQVQQAKEDAERQKQYHIAKMIIRTYEEDYGVQE
jgi:hypothetical protein